MAITITITKDNVVTEMRTINRLEVQNIQDPDARYRVEAGSEKTGVLNSCVDAADGELRSVLLDFLDPSKNTTLTFAFIDDSRRFDTNKQKALEENIYDYILHTAMARYYLGVSQGELMVAHQNMKDAARVKIEKLIYSRSVPVYA